MPSESSKPMPEYEYLGWDPVKESATIRMRGVVVTIYYRRDIRTHVACCDGHRHLNPLATGRTWRVVVTRADQRLRKLYRDTDTERSSFEAQSPAKE